MEARSRLSGPSTPSSAPPIRAFLIADVRGYTRFTDERGDEAAARLAASFVSMAQAHVESRSGSLVEARGDEILAVFDSAREAIRSAVELQATLATETARAPDLPLNVGIGIDAGEAVPLGTGYRGRALNLAARLCARARPGEILITPELAHLVGSIDGIRFDERGAVRLKGFSKPVNLVSVSAAADAHAKATPIAGRLTFQLLGPVEAAEDGRPIPLGGPRQRLVLAHLLLAANRVVTIDELVQRVWGAQPPQAARATIKSYVSHLRGVVGADRIEGRASGYQLHAEMDEIDGLRFEWLVRRARRQLSTEPRDAAVALAEALDLWRGDPLSDLAEFPSLAGEVTRLEQLRLGALEDMLSARLAAGDHADALPDLERLVAEHPFHERFWMQLMLARYRSGRQADSLEAYRRAHDRLRNELGIDPSPELQALHERILRQDPALQLTGRPLRGYRLLERIGEGAFGVIWRAADAEVGRDVAVKQIHPRFADHASFVRRFEHEAQTVARLEHPHIVPLYDYWRDGTGAYIVMRWMRGGSLDEVMESGPIDPDTGIGMVDQIASALSAAHRLGIVHQDVKPANVLLDEEGNAYLSDFGIAEDVTDRRDTVPSSSLGYCSPEQLRHEQATPRSDLYGLGMVVQALFERQEVPSRVRDVIARATADDPESRYADAREFAGALRDAFGRAVARTPVVVAEEGRNPYKGLRPFAEADADDFFGRDALVDRLLARLGEPGDGSRFLAVVGPSGSGKSSIVRAGLVPALRQGALPGSDRWFYSDLLPGSHPMEELETALLRVAASPPGGLLESLERGEDGLAIAAGQVLPPGDSELLLVIDQFEEVFTLVEDEDARAAFLGSVVAAVSDPRARVRIVVTIRADFYDRPLAHAGLAELFRGRSETVVPLTPEELEQAIVEPAGRVGLVPELALVAEMIADVSDQPGALPLLQFALTELYERRRDGVLTLEAYRDIEGVPGALARRAEELFAVLTDEERGAAKQLFLRLVTPGEGVADTRRLVARSELLSLDVGRSAMESVIAGFGRHRLLSFDRDSTTRSPTVEVAHEALLVSWDRLRAWIDAARDDLRAHRRLAAAAVEWDAGIRDPSFLLRGSRLDQVEMWVGSTAIALSQAEHEYVAASVRERDRERAEELARVERERHLERRSIQRLRALVAALTAAALVAAGLTAVAVGQRGRADRSARIATAGELASAADANLDTDPELSILLALESVETARPIGGAVLTGSTDALRRAIAASRVELTIDGSGTFVAMSPDGARLVSADDGGAAVFDRTGARLVALETGRPVTGADWSPDGSLVATASDDGNVSLWNAVDGGSARTFLAHRDGVLGMSFSRDARLLATLGISDGRAAVWEVATGALVRSFPAFTGGPIEPAINVADYVSFSPDGRRLAVGVPLFGQGEDEPGVMARIWDLESGRLETVLKGAPGIEDLQFSPDGRLLAVARGDILVAELWDARTGRRLTTLYGHRSNVLDVEFSDDGTRLATASGDGTAKLWGISQDPLGGRELLTLAGHGAFVTEVALGPADVLATASTDGTTRLWDVFPAGPGELLALRGVDVSSGANGDVEFTPDGSRLVGSSGPGGVARVWDARTGEALMVLEPDAPGLAVNGIDVSPDGTKIVTAGFDQLVKVWNAVSADELFTFGGHAGCPECFVLDVEFSPDGSLLASSGADQTARILDAGSGEERFRLDGHRNLVFGIEFSPDGSRLATASWDGTVRIWEVADGSAVGVLAPNAGELTSVAFSPEGDRLATGGFDGSIRLWDAATGRELSRWPADPGGVFDVAFSHDGSVVASGGATITTLWDATTGEVRATLPVIGTRISFSPDDRYLASSATGLVMVSALVLDELVEIAHDRVTRSLTDDECRRYLHVDGCPPDQ